MINQEAGFLTGEDGTTIFASVSIPAIPWRTGVVIVPSFGYEHTCAYESLRTLGARLVGAGCAVVRFDPAGRRTSPPRARSGLSEWVASAGLAAAHLRAQGAAQIVVVGHRFGTLAAAGPIEPPPDAVVALDPVVSGRRFLRELQVLQFMGVGTETRDDGGIVVLGEHLTGEDRAAIAACDLTRTVAPRCGLVVHRPGHEAATRLVDHWQAEAVESDELGDMIERGAENARCPASAIERIVEWVVALGTGRRAARAEHAAGLTPPAWHRTSESIWATDDGPGSLLADPASDATRPPERIERIGSPRLHAVSILPSETRPGPAVLFVGNGGQQDHGPAGSWTRWSRLLAASGTPAMRMCVRGRGESEDVAEPPCDHPDDRFYRWEHVGDVIRGAAHLRTLTGTVDGVACVGLCSSAFLALDAARLDSGIRRVVAISPQLDFLPAGTRPVRRRRAGRPGSLRVTRWLRSDDGLGEKFGRRLPAGARGLSRAAGATGAPSPRSRPFSPAGAALSPPPTTTCGSPECCWRTGRSTVSGCCRPNRSGRCAPTG